MWTDTDKQIRETAAELQEEDYKEAQRRNAVNSELSLLLPGHILLTLTGGDMYTAHIIERLWYRWIYNKERIPQIRCLCVCVCFHR